MIAVFETVRVKDGEMPLLDRHLARMSASQQGAGLAPLPADIPERCREVASRRPDDHVLRMEWDGATLDFTTRDLPPTGGLHLVIASIVHPGYEIKTTEREAFDSARREAKDRGADEAVLLTEAGFVAEGTILAIGWFEGRLLRVPSLDLKILPSIGRARVLETARESGIEVEEGHFGTDSLVGRPALAVTSVRGVVPVLTLDGRSVPTHPGVAELADRFWP